MLNVFSEVPLYIQLADELEKRLRRGDFEPPDQRQMPSRRELIETYGVSPDTADKAVRLLDGRGLVIRVQGKGVFARPLAELPATRREQE